MQIRKKITYQFTLIVAVILIFFSTIIYLLSANFRKQEFYDRLKEKAVTIAKIYTEDESNKNEIDNLIKQNILLLRNKEIVIFDSQNKQVYVNSDSTFKPISQKNINDIRKKHKINYSEKDIDVVGITYQSSKGEYVIYVSAYDRAGTRKLIFLGYVLFIGVFITTGITFLGGLFFSKQALRPISNIVMQIESITASNLNSRVKTENNTDEIGQLADKVNKMLGRIEIAFEIQQNFVASVSHEIRTPLTAITGQIEVALMNDKISTETKEIFASLLVDIRNLNKLSNSFLELVQTSLQASEIKMIPIRIDELVGQIRAELLKGHPTYFVEIQFIDTPEEEEKLTINGSEQLLKVALLNIVENACKYSQNEKALLNISFSHNTIELNIIDTGIGIPKNDLQYIFEPFFRSKNAENFSRGYGIGLSISEKVILLHHGIIKIKSIINEGTIITVTLPNILSNAS